MTSEMIFGFMGKFSMLFQSCEEVSFSNSQSMNNQLQCRLAGEGSMCTIPTDAILC